MTAANRALCCSGTGAATFKRQCSRGSDRYGILFRAQYRTFPNGDGITGIFVHIKTPMPTPVPKLRPFAEIIRLYNFRDLNLNQAGIYALRYRRQSAILIPFSPLLMWLAETTITPATTLFEQALPASITHWYQTFTLQMWNYGHAVPAPQQHCHKQLRPQCNDVKNTMQLINVHIITLLI